MSGVLASASVISIALLGVGFMFLTSWALTKTVLKGEVSTFTLELPPYRPPRFWQTVYTSIIDRTLIVLWRAIIFAAPAGALIWLVANVHIGDLTIANQLIGSLDPFGLFLGLNGVILLAYIIAIPANEIVIPTILMLSVANLGIAGIGGSDGVMFELDSAMETGNILTAGGWTLLTGINLMLFSLLHNPCSTTIYTIYQETKSWKWTTVASILPVIMGFVVTFLVTQVWRLF
jgi:ferrous iron transport protein B